MFDKDAFCREYGISAETVEQARVDWRSLDQIYADYVTVRPNLMPFLDLLSKQLREANKVHSVRARLKEPKHLIEKIIRKQADDEKINITVNDYREQITDLIGTRVIHLYKEDWLTIHQFITSQWDLQEKPTANIRDGDKGAIIESFKENDCNIRYHSFGYRSVHYLIKFSLGKDRIGLAEVQVRTIFEEGWSEIDHDLRYPYGAHPLIAEHLTIFNRLAGSADEMGSYSKVLKSTLLTLADDYRVKQDESRREIENLKSKIEHLQIEHNQKEKLQESIDSLSNFVKQTNPWVIHAMKLKPADDDPKRMELAGVSECGEPLGIAEGWKLDSSNGITCEACASILRRRRPPMAFRKR